MAIKKMIYDNLILNNSIWNQLQIMVQNNRLPHALIFHGPNGTGKEAHALELCGLLNPNKKNNILQSPNINLILPFPREKNISKNSEAISALSNKTLELLINMKKDKMKYPYNNIQLEKASSILINSIRDIKKNIHLYGVDLNQYRIHIILEAEKLCYPKLEPGNALLKILEEPPKNTIFILITNKKEKIIDTILSRCCEFYFPQLSEIETQKYLENLNCALDNEQKNILSKIFHRDLKAITHAIENNINLEEIKKYAIDFVRDIMKDQNIKSHSETIEKMFRKEKEKFKIFIKITIFIFNDLEKVTGGYMEDCLIITNINKIKDRDYMGCINIIEKTYEELGKNLNPGIGLLAMIINLKQLLI